jgi:hypothetical protein
VAPLKEEELPGTSYNNGCRRTRRQTEGAVKAQMYKYLDTTSDSDSDADDSDYNPLSSRRRCHKSSSKKPSKVVLRKLRSRKHKKSTTCRRKRTKETRNRSSYSSFGSDNGSPQREASNSRGNKRYLSKSSDESDYEKSTRKSKRSKKGKCTKKTKKRGGCNIWSSQQRERGEAEAGGQGLREGLREEGRHGHGHASHQLLEPVLVGRGPGQREVLLERRHRRYAQARTAQVRQALRRLGPVRLQEVRRVLEALERGGEQQLRSAQCERRRRQQQQRLLG